MENQTNVRFDRLEDQMGARFDRLERRINWLIGLQVTTLVTLGTLILLKA